jgi:hypothetical protein
MEEVGYVIFTIGAVGLGLLLAYGVYLNVGIIPALTVICVELIFAGIILAIND